MKIEKKRKENIVEIQEEVKIAQDDHELILEKGDKIRILEKFFKVITDEENLVKEGVIERLTEQLNNEFSFGAPWIITRIKRSSGMSGKDYSILAFMKNGEADPRKDKGSMRSFLTKSLWNKNSDITLSGVNTPGFLVTSPVIYEIESDFYDPGVII